MTDSIAQRKADARQKRSRLLATGGLALSWLAIASYLLLALCVVGVLVGGGLMAVGAMKGIKPLLMVGIVVVLASFAWVMIVGIAALALSVAQVASLTANVVAFQQAGSDSNTTARKSRWLAGIGIGASVLILAFALMTWNLYTVQQDTKHFRLDADYILRVEGYVSSYSTPDDRRWRFAPSLAAAAIRGGNPDLFESVIRMPTGHFDPPIIPRVATDADWPKYAAAIDEKSDYRYVGADLVHARALRAIEGRIVVLYNKTSYAGGRTVAFANHTQRFVLNKDLPAVFADASAARATFGLPPITLDGPPPIAP